MLLDETLDILSPLLAGSKSLFATPDGRAVIRAAWKVIERQLKKAGIQETPPAPESYKELVLAKQAVEALAARIGPGGMETVEDQVAAASYDSMKWHRIIRQSLAVLTHIVTLGLAVAGVVITLWGVYGLFSAEMTSGVLTAGSGVVTSVTSTLFQRFQKNADERLQVIVEYDMQMTAAKNNVSLKAPRRTGAGLRKT